MILDPTLFTEQISIGPLFHAISGQDQRKAQTIFTKFGDAFEEYVADTFRRMYPSRPFLVDRMSFNLKGRDAGGRAFEVDCALADASTAVIIETKAAFLREDAIIAPGQDRLLKELRLKYGAATAPGERDKGVAQLARSVGAIVREEWLGPNQEFSHTPVIHPVLVVHDGRLDTPALGYFLNEEFKTLLGKVPPNKFVRPLTVITITDLEDIENSVSNFSLVKLLEDYSLECPDRMRSLHNFIAFSDYADKILPSTYLRDASLDLIDALLRDIFPGAAVSAKAP